MPKRIYNVVLQSAIGDGPTPASETFFYDWSQIPDVPYYVRFSFASSSNPITQTNQMAMLYVDLAQSNNQIANAQSAYRKIGYRVGRLAINRGFIWGTNRRSYMCLGEHNPDRVLKKISLRR